MKLKILIFLTVTFLFIGNIGANNSTMYLSLVDGYNGFGRITNTSGESQLYDNHILNIIVGDSITWINNDPSDRIIIISDQKIWNDSDIVLTHAGKRYSYTFNNTGVYTFRIAEYDTFPKQTIIVSDITDVIDTIPENVTDKIEENVTDKIEENVTDKIEENVTDKIEENVTDKIEENVTDVVANNRTSLIMSIFAPLDILGNLKMTIIIIFIIAVIISLVKD